MEQYTKPQPDPLDQRWSPARTIYYDRPMRIHHKLVLDTLKEKFETDPTILSLIINGSVARGTSNDDSDVDFYLLVTKDSLRPDEDVCVDVTEIARKFYPQEYFDSAEAGGKKITMDFLDEILKEGSETARFAFQDALILFSKVPNLEEKIRRIPIYQEQEKRHKIVSFIQNINFHRSFLELGEYSSNPFLLVQTAYLIVLYSGWMILAHNNLLNPGRKQFLSQLNKAAMKPNDLLSLQEKLLKDPSIQNAAKLIDCVMTFHDWPIPTPEDERKWIQEHDQVSNKNSCHYF